MKKHETIADNTVKAKKPLTITELAKLHSSDPTHHTTDEELRNATLELTGNVTVDEESLFEIDNTTVIPPMDFEKEDKTEKKDDSDDTKDRVPNPYDVLG